MVVDDSAVVRGLIAKWLGDDPSVEVVATASNGEMALKNLAGADPEIVVLDIEMPVMDGLTALPKILEHSNEIQVLMASTLTKRNAEISMRALSMGAADYVSKPETTREVTTSLSFQQELVGKVVNLAAARRLQNGGKVYRGKGSNSLNEDILPQVSSRGVVAKRKMSSSLPRIIGVGSSTGGPQALLKFLNSMKDELRLPVLITQHMPSAFTSILADHLAKATGLPCKQAENGDIIHTGHVYVAPGDYHMIVVNEGGKKVIRLNQDEPENFCRPAVDPMFRSLAKLFGPSVLGVILTGMGHDGLKGSQEIVDAGGTVIAQDEASSIVWGMPGAVSQAGLCSAVLPLDEIGAKVIDITMGEAV
ncbi:protein-glutamate methylesterase/protein-glutamine glutaminase [Emcibacter nanhaiensis]|uniref:Protein-glutamate methylesterase/protein-glutamine glutaminase n=1 Tax=Emcibacter nanhaiensis TaxID=1505037 RepID=A0A501PPI0_9PROT|nr:chemotaxis response regulator protein-glutamate methylesterase [Emcibacter nanhaiensis]TPD62007.1 chemotaxis response regulator protein-glutamate methylesterase [Emcibacter nanhaiensis]